MPASADASESDEPTVKWRPAYLRSHSAKDNDHDASYSPRSRRSNKGTPNLEPGGISPLLLGNSRSDLDDFDLDGHRQSKGSYKARVGRHLSRGISNLVDGHHHRHLLRTLNSDNAAGVFDPSVHGAHDMAEILNEIMGWINEQKGKRQLRRPKRKTSVTHMKRARNDPDLPSAESSPNLQRSRSDLSESAAALEKLERIVEKGLTAARPDNSLQRKPSSVVSRKSSIIRKMRRQSTAFSSDSEYPEGGAEVPTVKAYLDNSQTLSYSGGSSVSQSDLSEITRVPTKDQESWLKFKFEIVRLAHTLKLKGWRHMPMERCSEIDVERLSGALTNAVYVVSPPPDMRLKGGATDNPAPGANKRPVKLLLRIYGPQVEHLINREKELRILGRLARKKIGPRLLGTFTNGRFEEFLEAKTLKPQDLRVPETSKQIARRMRELHEGIELEEEERNAGPFVWQNWDSWVDRCEQIVTFIDEQVLSDHPTSPDAQSMKQRGLVCGVEWLTFRRTVENYRKWLQKEYGGSQKLGECLVFAHNDTQYGNILRIDPPSRSPLLLPRNHHKQLVVIDFEYSNANIPGFEFANHFTEWCYNYHSATTPHACNTSYYPTIEEQNRFIHAYVIHRPRLAVAPGSTASSNSDASTPRQRPNDGQTSVNAGMTSSTSSLSSGHARSLREDSTSSLSNLTLDSRMPRTNSPTPMRDEDEEDPSTTRAQEEREINGEVRRLMQEARLWRVACSAQWILWGVIQATVPGFEEEHASDTASPTSNSSTDYADSISSTEPAPPSYAGSISAQGSGGDAIEPPKEEQEDEEEEFDNLSYAKDRALFFWGDCVQLGLIEREQLPAELQDRLKFVPY